MAARITRAKKKFVGGRHPVRRPVGRRAPPPAETVVGQAAYLAFTAGYAPGCGRDLAARRPRRGGHPAGPGGARPAARTSRLPIALLALMLLQHSRRDARVGADGRLVLLPDQDRRRWRRDEIDEALALLADRGPDRTGRPAQPRSYAAPGPHRRRARHRRLGGGHRLGPDRRALRRLGASAVAERPARPRRRRRRGARPGGRPHPPRRAGRPAARRAPAARGPGRAAGPRRSARGGGGAVRPGGRTVRQRGRAGAPQPSPRRRLSAETDLRSSRRAVEGCWGAIAPVREESVTMPIATPEVYAEMLDKAKARSFAYPAINVSLLPDPQRRAPGLRRRRQRRHRPGLHRRRGVPLRPDGQEHGHRLGRVRGVRRRGGQELPGQHRAAHRPLPQGQARRLRPAAARHLAPSGSKRGEPPLFQSHMWDGSAVPLEENLADRPGAARASAPRRTSSSRSRSASSAARRTASRARSTTSSTRTPEDALATVEALGTGENGRYLTALTFGNVHGVYKPGNVKLRPEILKNAQEAVVEKLGLDAGAKPVRPGLPRRLRLAARGDRARPSTTAS